MRKYLVILAVLIAVSLILAACGPTPIPEGDAAVEATGSTNTVMDTTEIKADERGSFVGTFMVIGAIIGIFHATILLIILVRRKDESLYDQYDNFSGVTALFKWIFYFSSWFLGILILGTLINVVADQIVDYWWLQEKGYSSIWFMKVAFPQILFLIGMVLTRFLLSKLDSRINPQSPVAIPDPTSRFIHDSRTIESVQNWSQAVKYGRYIIFFCWMVIGGFILKGSYTTILSYFNASSFGFADPVFNRDVSFYVFTMPFIRLIIGFAHFVLWGGILLTLAKLLLNHYMSKEYGNTTTDQAVITDYFKGASFYAGLYLLFWAGSAWLKKYQFLVNIHHDATIGFGAGYVELKVRTFMWGVMLIALVVSGLVLFVNTFLKRRWLVYAVPAVLAILVVVGLWIIPGVIQTLVVSPDEFRKEQPYIEYHLDSTKAAYYLTDVITSTFTFDPEFPASAFQENNVALEQARIMDWKPLLEDNKSLQQIRRYYDFADTDVVPHEDKVIMVGIREMNIDELPEKADNWVNRHLKYTHGYGYTIADVSRTDSKGLPDYTMRNIPPEGRLGLYTNRNEIYFGELTEDWVAINSAEDEFGYPIGTEDAEYVRYAGDAGVRLGSGLRRFALAASFGDIKLLVSSALSKDSRLLYHRDIRQAIRLLLPPGFELDGDPYPAITTDRIYFIWDVYSIAENLPYAQPFENGKNYIRNSIKAVFDTYEGGIAFYIADTEDPILKVWQAVYPDLFRPISEMDPAIKAYVRYPERMFLVQAHMLNLYHTDNPEIYFNREDVWTTPRERYGNIWDNWATMDARYITMRLPGEETEEVALILPFVLAGEDGKDLENLVGWVAARSKPGHYGELLVHDFPQDETILGPVQIERMIDTYLKKTNQVTLLGSPQNPPLWGNTMAIPVQHGESGSVLYIKPLFASTGQERRSTPVLLRIFAVTGDGRLVEGGSLQAITRKIYRDEWYVMDEDLTGSDSPPVAPPTDAEKEVTPEPPVAAPPGSCNELWVELTAASNRQDLPAVLDLSGQLIENNCTQ